VIHSFDGHGNLAEGSIFDRSSREYRLLCIVHAASSLQETHFAVIVTGIVTWALSPAESTAYSFRL
jgi:hypothetical protein